jgi:uncharacterized protein (DUF58 family)
MSSPPVAQTTPEQVLLRLDWQVVRRLDGLLQGDYRTLFYGAGVDFADLREYQPTDDARYIDWNVTARMDTPYVREYLEDRELTAWMLLDRSPSMAFGPEERTKGRVLIDLVTTLSYLLARRGNRIGAILYNNVVERTVPPRGGRKQVLRLTRDLMQPAPRGPEWSHPDRAEHDQAPVARVPDFGLPERSGLGTVASAALPAA